MVKRIVCFGDSNTWGSNAENGMRFSEEVRWPCLLQKFAGNDYQIIEEGLPGRTSVIDDPLFDGLNGLNYLLPCLKSHAPIETLIIMLGTNDTKERLHLTPYNIAQGITRLALRAEEILKEINGQSFNLFIVAPPPIGKEYANTMVSWSMGKDCDVKSEQFPGYLKEMLAEHAINFIDTKGIVSMNTIDYMHLDAEGHELLAKLIFNKIKKTIREEK